MAKPLDHAPGGGKPLTGLRAKAKTSRVPGEGDRGLAERSNARPLLKFNLKGDYKAGQ